jgi:hypothetical protein
MPGRKLLEHGLTENSIRTGPSEVCGPNTYHNYGINAFFGSRPHLAAHERLVHLEAAAAAPQVAAVRVEAAQVSPHGDRVLGDLAAWRAKGVEKGGGTCVSTLSMMQCVCVCGGAAGSAWSRQSRWTAKPPFQAATHLGLARGQAVAHDIAHRTGGLQPWEQGGGGVVQHSVGAGRPWNGGGGLPLAAQNLLMKPTACLLGVEEALAGITALVGALGEAAVPAL